jgi:hypothetical protein
LSLSQMGSSGNLPASVIQQMTDMFKTQYTHALEVSMRVGIIVVLSGAIASLFIAGHIKKDKTGTALRK